MKYQIPAVLWLVVLAVSGVSPAIAGELAVTIDGVKKPSGTLVVTLMTEAGWDRTEKSIRVETVAAQSAIDGKGRVTVKFADIPEVSYAVGVIHDENDNHKLDTGLMGIPKEGWGNSNNPKVWRKPYFSEVRVDVGAAPVPIVIKLN
jgi:uncharacterized protein (DUF2141 family)